ncbi:Alpha-D-ribose 1-methylphosphonate 5-triphosphate diphosphatase [Roseivivax jejudonensis]|uniref:Alpha-D-ribose 1-methylphosphonate 5-triphosphate diphosphatase n=1 Tax=Roseivivax jejudonensis TaxID=1529041 RepID=A0A1X6YAY7_9RHOB|nr:alpha-D-ribose 1-methylphosphonate 5-triphosphate diphosphatase [Roseivivax jejudonensis]SLN14065.1 Alpha-D-ribose 1-methylphosphonate 5-triphosphate diphosphatase [Roseivivax jejudonensis]
MLRLVLSGATTLRRDGWSDAPVAIAAGRFAENDAPNADLSGYRLLPGIVDLHGDGFERHVAPRRGALRETRAGLFATEAELAANGITTGVLAQFWSWEGGLRGPDFAEALCADWAEMRSAVATDLRMQLRLETHMIDDYSRVARIAARHGIDYLVFNDHLQHDRLEEGRRPKQMTGQALKSGRSPDAHFELMLGLHARGPEVAAASAALASDLSSRGVTLGSHDDATAEERAAWRARGATIAEFPETRVAAEGARAGGDGIVLGAPNVVRGASHKGNVSAVDLVAAGLCDALASDYHYPAPLAAVARIVSLGVLDWTAAWRLVSEGPARLLGLADRGCIADGLRADLVILDDDDRVAGTIAGGRVSYLRGDAAERLIAAR